VAGGKRELMNHFPLTGPAKADMEEYSGNPESHFNRPNSAKPCHPLIVQFGGPVCSTVPLSLEQWVTIIGASASVLVIGFLLRVVYPLIKTGLVKKTS
jgi:hypothetical protein